MFFLTLFSPLSHEKIQLMKRGQLGRHLQKRKNGVVQKNQTKATEQKRSQKINPPKKKTKNNRN